MYYLIGNDEFRLWERLSQIRQELQRTSPLMEIKDITVTATNVRGLFDDLTPQSLWGQPVLVIWRGFLAVASPVLQKELEEWIKQPNPAVVLVLVETVLPPANSLLWRKIKSQAEIYQVLSSAETRRWVQQKCQTVSLTVSLPAISWLVANFGDDLWRLSNEIHKLSLLAQDKAIDVVFLQEHLTPTLNDNIFRTIDALAQKKFAQANRLVNTQLDLGTPEGELLTMIAYQFRNIIAIKTLLSQRLSPTQVASQSRLHPYVIKKTIPFAKDFSWPQLRRVMALIHRVDAAIKRGQVPSRVGLDILIAQVVNC